MKGKIKIMTALVCLYLTAGNARALTNEKSFPFFITVEVDEQLHFDTLCIAFANNPFQSLGSEKDTRYFEKTGTHSFRFTAEEPVPRGYFNIQYNRPAGSPATRRFIPMTPAFLWEAGDSISLSVTRKEDDKFAGYYRIEFEFKGPGSEKYNVWERMLRTPSQARLPGSTSPVPNCEELVFPHLIGPLEILEQAKASLGEFHYQLLKAELVGRHGEIFQRFRKPQKNISVCDSLLRLRIYDEKATYRIDSLTSGIPLSIAYRSGKYISYLVDRLLHEAYAEKAASKPFDLVSVITERYEAPVRDKLLMRLFIKDIPDQDLYGHYLRIQNLVTDPEGLRALNEIAPLLPEMPVVDFSLPDPHGNRVSLSDFKGKVVFIDLWFTGCFACTSYYRDVLREAEEQLKEEKDIVFISISVDKDPLLWKKSISSGKYTSAHAVNLYTEGKRSAHEWTVHYGFQGAPKFMIVDRHGKVHRIFNNGFADEINSTDSLVTRLKKVLKEE